MTLKEMTRTLQDYRPQHDNDCTSLLCGSCGFNPKDIRCNNWPAEEREHEFKPQLCSCGLDALLAECAPIWIALAPPECGASWTGNFGPTLVCSREEGHDGPHTDNGDTLWKDTPAPSAPSPSDVEQAKAALYYRLGLDVPSRANETDVQEAIDALIAAVRQEQAAEIERLTEWLRIREKQVEDAAKLIDRFTSAPPPSDVEVPLRLIEDVAAAIPGIRALIAERDNLKQRVEQAEAALKEVTEDRNCSDDLLARIQGIVDGSGSTGSYRHDLDEQVRQALSASRPQPSDVLPQVAREVIKAWHALRVEEVRVWGPVKIDHAGRCGAQTNALMNACENLALWAPTEPVQPSDVLARPEKAWVIHTMELDGTITRELFGDIEHCYEVLRHLEDGPREPRR